MPSFHGKLNFWISYSRNKLRFVRGSWGPAQTIQNSHLPVPLRRKLITTPKPFPSSHRPALWKRPVPCCSSARRLRSCQGQFNTDPSLCKENERREAQGRTGTALLQRMRTRRRPQPGGVLSDRDTLGYQLWLCRIHLGSRNCSFYSNGNALQGPFQWASSSLSTSKSSTMKWLGGLSLGMLSGVRN